MFSNTKKFIKKNILLIGIVVLLIIIAVYFLYINVKEGFTLGGPGGMYRGGPPLEKVQLVPVQTIDNFYTSLTDPSEQKFVAPIVSLYKLFALNYDAMLSSSLQIIDASNAQEMEDSKVATYPSDPVYTGTIKDGKIKADHEAQVQAIDKSNRDNHVAMARKWALIINPGLENILINAINWLPSGKLLFDDLMNNDFYGIISTNDNTKVLSLIARFLNTLYADDQLSKILGPDFAKSNPNFPFKMPIDVKNTSALDSTLENMQHNLKAPAQDKLHSYFNNIVSPFFIIHDYITTSFVIPDTIINMVNKLNDALSNAATYQDTIRQLTGQLNVALANDETDQSTITNLQEEVKDLQSRKPDLSPALSNLAKIASKKGRK